MKCEHCKWYAQEQKWVLDHEALAERDSRGRPTRPMKSVSAGHGECRFNPPTKEGFPPVMDDSWCRQFSDRLE